MHKPVPRAFGGIPPLIKRNTVLFALSQSFVGAGTQLAYGIGPLMVIAVTGSASLAGLTVGLFGISRFLVSYPVGKITDTYGRKPGILFGQGLAMIGSFVSGLAMLAGSAIGLTLGMVIFAMRHQRRASSCASPRPICICRASAGWRWASSPPARWLGSC